MRLLSNQIEPIVNYIYMRKLSLPSGNQGARITELSLDQSPRLSLMYTKVTSFDLSNFLLFGESEDSPSESFMHLLAIIKQMTALRCV